MKKRIESMISKTAQWTCIARAVSHDEKNPLLRCEDSVASLFLPGYTRRINRIFAHLMCKLFSAKGSYAQVIARTKYIDALFHRLPEEIGQIAILGAGLDTRAIRFGVAMADRRFFELDAPATQQMKRTYLQKLGVKLPESLAFVPIDFDRSDIRDSTMDAGFRSDIPSLFLMEGLMMYLQPESVVRLMESIRNLAAKGSILVFDYLYASTLRGENDYRGKNRIILQSAKIGEKCYFGLEKGELPMFLERFGFRLIDESDSRTLEETYFRNANGRTVRRILGSHGPMVIAIQ